MPSACTCFSGPLSVQERDSICDVLQDGVHNCAVWLPCFGLSSTGIQGSRCQAGGQATTASVHVNGMTTKASVP